MNFEKLAKESAEEERREKEKLETRLKEALEQIKIEERSGKSGCITLNGFLYCLASEPLKELRKNLSFVELNAIDLEYYEGYMTALGSVKRSILNRELIVRQLSTKIEANDEPGIIAWCESNHTMKSIEEAGPHWRIVVRHDDAKAWYEKKVGGPCPDWLKGKTTKQKDDLSEALAKAESERALLSAELAAIKSQRDDYDLLREENQKLRASLEAAESEARPKNHSGCWPWGTHETELLRLLAVAAERFWKPVSEGGCYDPDEGPTPTNPEVAEWLVLQGVNSPTQAKYMAQILRPKDLPKGRPRQN